MEDAPGVKCLCASDDTHARRTLRSRRSKLVTPPRRLKQTSPTFFIPYKASVPVNYDVTHKVYNRCNALAPRRNQGQQQCQQRSRRHDDSLSERITQKQTSLYYTHSRASQRAGSRENSKTQLSIYMRLSTYYFICYETIYGLDAWMHRLTRFIYVFISFFPLM